MSEPLHAVTVDGVTYPWIPAIHSFILASTEDYTALATPMLSAMRLQLFHGPVSELGYWDLAGAWCYAKGDWIFRATRGWVPGVSAPSGWFRDVSGPGDVYAWEQPGAPLDRLGELARLAYKRAHPNAV